MSFMTAEEYYNYLYQIQSSNPPSKVFISSIDKPYEIDVNTRKIKAPEFLSVSRDHKSETIYFIIDRYVDYMDLAETCCMIHYTNLKTGKSFLYNVPFYDIVSYNTDVQKKILFPWCIDGGATEEAGIVRFSISFFKIDHESKKFLYNLNTLPAESRVLHGMHVQDLESDYTSIDVTLAENLQAQINALNKNFALYWEEENY